MRGEPDACSVLIVDDDTDVRDTLADVLKDAGYDVVVAQDGAEALRLLRASDALPCLILLDLMMPVMDGYQFRATQKNDSLLSAIPVVVLTAGDRVDAGSLEVWGVLKKPFKIPTLLAAVEQHC